MINKITKSLKQTYSKYDLYKTFGHYKSPKETFNEQKNRYSLIDQSIQECWDNKLEFNEVEARIYKNLKQFKIDLDYFNMNDSFEKLKLDYFEQINLLTSLENEFRIVLPENVFDNMRSCQDFAEFIISDGKAFQIICFNNDKNIRKIFSKKNLKLSLKQNFDDFDKGIQPKKTEYINFSKQFKVNNPFKNKYQDSPNIQQKKIQLNMSFTDLVDQYQLSQNNQDIFEQQLSIFLIQTKNESLEYSEYQNLLQFLFFQKNFKNFFLLIEKINFKINEKITFPLENIQIEKLDEEQIQIYLNMTFLVSIDQKRKIFLNIFDYLLDQQRKFNNDSILKNYFKDLLQKEIFPDDQYLLISEFLQSYKQTFYPDKLFVSQKLFRFLTGNKFQKISNEIQSIIFKHYPNLDQQIFLSLETYNKVKKNYTVSKLFEIAYHYNDLEYFIMKQNNIIDFENTETEIQNFNFNFVKTIMKTVDFRKEKDFLEKINKYIKKCSSKQQSILKLFLNLDKKYKDNTVENIIGELLRNSFEKFVFNLLLIGYYFGYDQQSNNFYEQKKFFKSYSQKLSAQKLKNIVYDFFFDKYVLGDEYIQSSSLNSQNYLFFNGGVPSTKYYESFVDKKYSEQQRGKSVYSFNNQLTLKDCKFKWTPEKLDLFKEKIKNIEQPTQKQVFDLLEQLDVQIEFERTLQMTKQKDLDYRTNLLVEQQAGGMYFEDDDQNDKNLEILLVALYNKNIVNNKQISFDKYISKQLYEDEDFYSFVDLIIDFKSQNGKQFLVNIMRIFKNDLNLYEKIKKILSKQDLQSLNAEKLLNNSYIEEVKIQSDMYSQEIHRMKNQQFIN